MNKKWWEENPELFAEGWKGDALAVLCLCAALIGLAVLL